MSRYTFDAEVRFATGAAMKIAGLFATAITIVTIFSAGAQAQTAMGSTPSPKDTAIIFEPAQPLIKTQIEAARDYPNTWGFSASFSDYGFGGGLFLGHNFGPDLEAQISAEMSTAEASREFDLITNDKV